MKGSFKNKDCCYFIGVSFSIEKKRLLFNIYTHALRIILIIFQNLFVIEIIFLKESFRANEKNVKFVD